MSVNTTIYYFSGTGNSLAVTRNLSVELGACDLAPIAKVWRQDVVAPETESVGIVCPVYFAGLPAIVVDFVVKLDLSRAGYVWAVFTCKAPVSGGALPQLSALLEAKGNRLDAGFYIRSVGTYVPKYDIPLKEVQQGIQADAAIYASQAAEIIAKRGRKRQFSPYDLIWSILHKKFAETVHESDAEFHLLDGCTSCGICAKVCPVDNIRLVGGLPQWQHRCQRCLACLHFCPEEVIQYGKKTVKHKRYHHPYITLKDIQGQKG